MASWQPLLRCSAANRLLHSPRQLKQTAVCHYKLVHISPSNMADTFLYFGFGSNLLRERILINNASAKFKTIARLDNYHLCFDGMSPNWKGSTATISEKTGDHVWGVVWQMDVSDIPNLDRQEGVSNGEYKPIDVTVVSPSGEEMLCRSYQLLMTGDIKVPSPQYLSVIRRGAAQNQLPEEYQQRLAAIPHNGYSGELEVMKNVEKLIEMFKDRADT